MKYKGLIWAKTVVLAVVFLISNVAMAEVYQISCSLNDDRNGDEQLVALDEVYLDTESEEPYQVIPFVHDDSSHNVKMHLQYNGEDGGLLYLSVEDETDGIIAQNVSDGSQDLYVFLSTKDVGLMASCDVDLIGMTKKELRKKAKAEKRKDRKARKNNKNNSPQNDGAGFIKLLDRNKELLDEGNENEDSASN